MTKSGLPEEVYTDAQALFRSTPVVLFGSGFSCSYNLPSMGALGAHLVKTVGPNLASSDAKKLWQSIIGDVEKNLEQGLGKIAAGAGGQEEIIAAIRTETAKLILEATIKAEAEISSYSTSNLAPVRLFQRLYNGAPQNADSVSVITTNYDTLIEFFCDLADVPLDTGFYGYRYRRPRNGTFFQTSYSQLIVPGKKAYEIEHRPNLTLRLLKPHGSITWHSTQYGTVEITNDRAKISNSIVVPGPTKYQDALTNTLFDTIRAEMNITLSRATSLLCVGFGFNDEHLQGMINHRLENHMPILIITRGLTDPINALIKKYPHALVLSESKGGSVCNYRGSIFHTADEVWTLDGCLKTFLE